MDKLAYDKLVFFALENLEHDLKEAKEFTASDYNSLLTPTPVVETKATKATTKKEN